MLLWIYYYLFVTTTTTKQIHSKSNLNPNNMHFMMHPPSYLISYTKQSCSSLSTLRRTPLQLPFLRRKRNLLLQSSLSSSSTIDHSSPITITIIGGGMAGLAVTYHLLNQLSIRNTTNDDNNHIRIVDQNPMGQSGGASAVAGGLLHPLSPKGKIVYKGLDGIQETNHLLQVSMKMMKMETNEQTKHTKHTNTTTTSSSSNSNSILLKDHLYRVAISEQNAKTFQQTAKEYPHICDWIAQTEMQHICHHHSNNNNDVYGGLLLKNGCQVIDVPTYLQGLWKACEHITDTIQNCSLSWVQIQNNTTTTVQDWLAKHTNEDETIVYAAGSGLFDSTMLDNYDISFPIQLVHGQSLILRYNDMEDNDDNDNDDSNYDRIKDAFLCGKYVIPLSDPDLVLVGSTHEYKDTLMSQSDVINEMQQRTVQVAPQLWQQSVVHKVTQGTRVQTERGKYGRLPIIGKLPNSKRDSWIFTGLSSRGLLYHALYGKLLANAILNRSEDIFKNNNSNHDDILWWKTKLESTTREKTRK